jgi:hypothetical protein
VEVGKKHAHFWQGSIQLHIHSKGSIGKSNKLKKNQIYQVKNFRLGDGPNNIVRISGNILQLKAPNLNLQQLQAGFQSIRTS